MVVLLLSLPFSAKSGGVGALSAAAAAAGTTEIGADCDLRTAEGGREELIDVASYRMAIIAGA